MKTYLVKFTPCEPYFFGNEKSFLFPGQRVGTQQANKYFIRSESTPSQSTLLGALRYLLLPVKKADFSYDDVQKAANERAVGPESFDPDQNRSFGMITRLSPMFLCKGDEILVPAPLDHASGECYAPFSDYKVCLTPVGAKRYYTEQYDPKKGFFLGYLRLSDGKMIPEDELITRIVRLGILRGATSDEQELFKREYCCLESGCSFAVYLELDGDTVPQDSPVFLGQGKSAFSVSFTETDAGYSSVSEGVKKYLRDDVVYCASDAFLPGDITSDTLFSVVNTKTYRAYSRFMGTVSKSATLYTLVAAGSVFIPADKTEFMKCLENGNVEKVGYNQFITK